MTEEVAVDDGWAWRLERRSQMVGSRLSSEAVPGGSSKLLCHVRPRSFIMEAPGQSDLGSSSSLRNNEGSVY